jgi:periodic tryptophan protein 2
MRSIFSDGYDKCESIVANVDRCCLSSVGRAWASCTTEGLLIYSIDTTAMFDPIDLNESITPLNIRQTLYEKADAYLALLMALKLNEKSLISEILENIDTNQSKIVDKTISSVRQAIDRLLSTLYLL